MATAPATAVTAAPTAQNVASATASSAAATTAAPAPPPAPETVSELMQRKIQLEEDLKNMEKQIRELEDSYIEDTHQYGNVIKGWEGYLNVKPKAPTSRTRIKISNRDRLFSLSSVTAPESSPGDDEAEEYQPAPRASVRDKKKQSYSEDDDEYEP